MINENLFMKKITAILLVVTLLLSCFVFDVTSAYGSGTKDAASTEIVNQVADDAAEAVLTKIGINKSSQVALAGGWEFSRIKGKDKEYNLTIKAPLRTSIWGGGLKFDLDSNCDGATYKFSYTDVSSGQQSSVMGTNKGIKCVTSEKSKYSVSDVKIEVTPPEDSTLTPTEYTIHVKLEDNNQIVGLGIAKNNDTAVSYLGLLDYKNSKPKDMEKTEYIYDVAESVKGGQLEISVLDDEVEVYVNDKQIESGGFPIAGKMKCAYQYKAVLMFDYGENVVTIRTHRKNSKASTDQIYTLTVNRARPSLKFTNVEIEDGLLVRGSEVEEGAVATVTAYTGAATSDSKTFTFFAESMGNIVTYDIPATKENVGKYEEKIITEENKLVLQRPTYERNGAADYYGRKKMSPTTATIYVTKQGDDGAADVYTQYEIDFYPRMPDGATGIVRALKAPGQFVNSQYGGGIMPEWTLGADINTDNLYNITSLGTFGGYIEYMFNEPIQNNPNNQYGIDFVVYGNSFGPGAAEPAAVSVSSNGEDWYDLAGSEHYELTTDWNYWVKYCRAAKESGKATRMTSFASKDNAESWLTPRNDMYYPINECHKIFNDNQDIGSEIEFSGVCTYNGKGQKPQHAFGYVDVTPNGEVDPLAIAVNNPYAGGGAQYMDISWAVDKDGKPVYLDSVKYVKVKTCTLYFSNAFGEASPEVGGITKVNATTKTNAVGVTDNVKALVVNGKDYANAEFEETNNGLTKYLEVGLEDNTTQVLDVQVTASNQTDNLWINNEESTGSCIRKIPMDDDGNRMVRIISQNGDKEPVIYVIKFTGGTSPKSNADMDEILLSPGDIKKQPEDFADQSLTFTVENNVEKISITGKSLNPYASMALLDSNGKKLCELQYGEKCEPIPISIGENTFKIKVTSKDETATNEYIIVVNRKTAVQQGDNNSISVTFIFTGDACHGCDSKGNPNSGHSKQIWIPKTTVDVPKDSTVKYLTDMMLYNADIAFKTTEGTYIAEVMHPTEKKWLGEFDNGNNSGWMYRINGLIADEGYAARVMKTGDVIEWFYTDDYLKETGYESGWLKDLQPVKEESKEVTTSGTSGSAATSAPTEVKVTEKKNADGTKETVAESKVSAENQSEILKQAAENKSTEIILEVSKADSKGADSVQLSLEVSFVKNVADKTDADLTVNTENGKVTLDQETIKTVLAEAKGSTIIIEIAKVTKPTETQKKAAGTNGDIFRLLVKSGDKIISDFNKGKATVTVEIPTKLQDKKVAAVHIAEDGKIEQMAGKTVKIDGKVYYIFETPHFSVFALVDAEELGLEVNDEEANIEKIKELISDMSLKARSSKTSKKNIKVTLTVDKSTAAAIKEIEDMGYTVKYKYYRSTKKASKYQAKITKTTKSYTNTAGKKGTRYYYKARIQVYDKDGKLVAQTALKQCKYAVRTWTK